MIRLMNRVTNRLMKRLLTPALAMLAVAASGSSSRAETKLTTAVFTASPAGFLVNSALVSGDKEAVLIDGQLTLSDAHRLVGMILDSKKTLTTVYVTHWHPDHYFGLVVVKQAFPKVKIVAQPATVAEIKKTWAAKVKQWSPMFGANLPTKPLIPSPLAGNAIMLEGQTLEVHGPVQGDASTNSYVWIPSIKTLVTGDIVYQGIFPWTAETNAASRAAWIKTLDELAALGATTVVAGHKEPSSRTTPAVSRRPRPISRTSTTPPPRKYFRVTSFKFSKKALFVGFGTVKRLIWLTSTCVA